MGIQACATQEAGPFWGPEKGYNRGKLWVSNYSEKLYKSSSHEQLA